jgi:hypothetical protein
MTLWLRTRAIWALLFVTVATLAAIVLPVSEMRATPSPAGATLALAILVALIEPIVLGWAMTRGDQHAERISPRPLWLWDLSLVLGLGLIVTLAAFGLRVAGVAPAGGIAARAMATFLGTLLIAQPIAGWRTASLAPVILFVAVVIVGRGDDIDHPAPWAWIAAPEANGGAWLTSLICLGVGTVIAVVRRPSGPLDEG